MRKSLFTLLISCMILPVNAQLFSRDSLGGALIGGIAGGVIGHNSGRRTAEGIAIGAGTGLVLGALTSRYRNDYHGGYDQYSGVPYAPAYRSRPNYAVTGAVLGGVAGGVIGHNQGRHTAEGIAIGAGAGLLLGAVAESELRKRERLTAYQTPVYVNPQPSVVTTSPVVTTTPVIVRQESEPAPQQVTIINHYYGSQGASMGGANALFGR